MKPVNKFIKNIVSKALVISGAFSLALLFNFAIYDSSLAQEVHENYQGTFKAKITNILGEETREIWNDTWKVPQTLHTL